MINEIRLYHNRAIGELLHILNTMRKSYCEVQSSNTFRFFADFRWVNLTTVKMINLMVFINKSDK